MSTLQVHTKSKQLVPELRFPEFVGEWSNEKLGDHTESISSGKSSSKDQGTYPVHGSTGVIASTDNYTHEGENILVARVGANAGLINKVDGKYGVTDNTLVVILDDSIDVKFCESFLIKFDLNRLIFGSGQPLITGGLLKGIKIGFPSLPEQQKIASFLSAVDEKIQQLSRKKALLEQYKKGVMQQIFSQQIRFKPDFPFDSAQGAPALKDGKVVERSRDYPDWEVKRLGEILTIGSGKDYKHLEKGDIPVFGTGGYMLSVNEKLYSGKTVFIGRKGTIDKPFFFNGDFWTVDTLFFTHEFQNVLPEFVFLIFDKTNWYKYNEASGVPSLSKGTIEKIKCEIPSFQEQEKICDFTWGIINEIYTLEKLIVQAQEFKKGLLQKMFV